MNNIPLGPVDYVFTGNESQPITFAFLYSDKLDPVALKRGLDEILKSFPILQSQLVKNAENDYGFQNSANGLTFDVVESDVSFRTSRDIKGYITPVNSVEGNPLTRIMLTQTPSGSVLAVSISHALVDGFSYFHFLSSWARKCKGERILNPDLQRDGLFSSYGNSEKAITATTVFKDCGLFYGSRRSPRQNGPVREERTFVSRDDLRVQLENAKSRYPETSFSENDVLVASLWKKTVPHWMKGDDNPETHVTCPVDFRRVLKGLPKNYLGCAVCFATASLDYDTLLKSPVETLAQLVNKTIRKVNHDYAVRSLRTLENLRRQKGLTALEKIHLRHPRHGLIVTNLSRMPMHHLDFGSGSPVDFLIYADVLRSAAILPAENGLKIVVLHPPE